MRQNYPRANTPNVELKKKFRKLEQSLVKLVNVQIFRNVLDFNLQHRGRERL
jgi:hypothetical protein